MLSASGLLEMKARDVVAAVISLGPKYLVCRRPAHNAMVIYGDFLEASESFSAEVASELTEKLGLETVGISGSVFLHQDPGSAFIIHFIPVAASGLLELHEHSEARWCPFDELIAHSLAPTGHRFVELPRG